MQSYEKAPIFAAYFVEHYNSQPILKSNRMKLRYKNTLLFVVFLLSFATFASAQSTLAAILYNKDLPQALFEQKEMEGETAVRLFFTALQQNDTKTLESYLASKTTYQSIVASYPYEQETKREQAKRDVEAGHAKLIAELRENLTELRNETQKKGVNIADLTLTQVKITLKAHEAMRGGRATLELKDKTGNLYYLRLNSFYEFNGKWYLLGKGKWKPFNTDFAPTK